MRDNEFEAQNTTMIVAGFHHAARRPIIIGVCVFAALGVAMAFQVGSGRTGLLRNNTVAAMGLGAPDTTAFTPAASPVYGVTTVEVVLGSDGDLTVDGKALGSSRFHDLQLIAGNHTVVAHLGDKVLTEKFRTSSSESLRIEFQKSRVRVFREVTPAL